MMMMKMMMMLITSLDWLYDLETSAYYLSPDEYHKEDFLLQKTFWTMLQDYRVFSYKKHIYKTNELKSDQE